MTKNPECSSNVPGTSIILRDTIVKFIDDSRITEVTCKFLYDNEIYYLQQLRHLPFIPKLIFSIYPIIIMQNCGEPITSLTAEQHQTLKSHIATLHENKCYHNDIKPDNILIKDDHLTVIDFGWSTATAEVPSNFPEILGGDFRGDNGINDFESLEKVFKHFQ